MRRDTRRNFQNWSHAVQTLTKWAFTSIHYPSIDSYEYECMMCPISPWLLNRQSNCTLLLFEWQLMLMLAVVAITTSVSWNAIESNPNRNESSRNCVSQINHRPSQQAAISIKLEPLGHNRINIQFTKLDCEWAMSNGGTKLPLISPATEKWRMNLCC